MQRPPDTQQDLALADRMLRGEAQAMSEFCVRFLPRVYRFALHRLGSPDDAEDVVQVVLAKATRRIETYRGESPLLAWLLVICRREVAGHLARSGRQVVGLFAPGEEDGFDNLPGPDADEPDSVGAREQLAVLVHESLDRLPERQAVALELKYVEGYSSKEIARHIGISDEAVQSLLARARRTFREVCDERILEAMATDNGR